MKKFKKHHGLELSRKLAALACLLAIAMPLSIQAQAQKATHHDSSVIVEQQAPDGGTDPGDKEETTNGLTLKDALLVDAQKGASARHANGKLNTALFRNSARIFQANQHNHLTKGGASNVDDGFILKHRDHDERIFMGMSSVNNFFGYQATNLMIGIKEGDNSVTTWMTLDDNGLSLAGSLGVEQNIIGEGDLTLRKPAGSPVNILLQNSDNYHSWSIKKLNGNTSSNLVFDFDTNPGTSYFDEVHNEIVFTEEGDIRAIGNINAGADVTAAGNMTAIADVTAGGNLNAAADVTAGRDLTVDRDISASGQIVATYKILTQDNFVVKTQDNINQNNGLLFENSGGKKTWFIRRQDRGLSNNTADLVFASGFDDAEANLSEVIRFTKEGDIHAAGDLITNGEISFWSDGIDPGQTGLVKLYGLIDMLLDDPDDAYSAGHFKAGMYGAKYYDATTDGFGNMLSFYVSDPNQPGIDYDNSPDMRLFEDGSLEVKGALRASELYLNNQEVSSELDKLASLDIRVSNSAVGFGTAPTVGYGLTVGGLVSKGRVSIQNSSELFDIVFDGKQIPVYPGVSVGNYNLQNQNTIQQLIGFYGIAEETAGVVSNQMALYVSSGVLTGNDNVDLAPDIIIHDGGTLDLEGNLQLGIDKKIDFGDGKSMVESATDYISLVHKTTGLETEVTLRDDQIDFNLGIPNASSMWLDSDGLEIDAGSLWLEQGRSISFLREDRSTAAEIRGGFESVNISEGRGAIKNELNVGGDNIYLSSGTNIDKLSFMVQGQEQLFKFMKNGQELASIDAEGNLHSQGMILEGDGSNTATIDSQFNGTIVMGGEDGTSLQDSDIKNSYYSAFSLWVENGIVTEDIAYAPRTIWDGDDTDDDSGLNWPDYVFSSNYQLRSLDELQTYIEKNSHLPEIPSATEINTDGFSLVDMDMNLLKKVEELTLYTIDQENKIKEQEQRILELERLVKALVQNNPDK